MDCSRMSDHVFFVIVLLVFCITEAYQMTNVSSQPAKIMKTKNIDIVLRCLLLDKHERFNQNANVSWWFKKTCQDSCVNTSDEEDWTEISCGKSCGLSMDLNDKTAANGFYLCKIMPYKISETNVLNVEVTKTFEITLVDPMISPPPELFNDTPNKFSLPMNSQLVLQCKCRSSQKPVTIKWFRKKEESFSDNDEHKLETYNNFMESSRSIKYFENFYEPLPVSGLKELTEHVYLSKLIVSNVSQSSVYVCVAINYFGFTYRQSFVNLQVSEAEDVDDDASDFQENNYEILVLIPIVLLMPSSVLMCTLFYLLINRQIMRNNKNVEVV